MTGACIDCGAPREGPGLRCARCALAHGRAMAELRHELRERLPALPSSAEVAVEAAPIMGTLEVDVRPRRRGDCERAPRPCPWMGCRYHLALDLTVGGHPRFNFGDDNLERLDETCALDVAERGGLTLEEVGAMLGLTRERARQIEVGALAKLHGLPVYDDGASDDACHAYQPPA